MPHWSGRTNGVKYLKEIPYTAGEKETLGALLDLQRAALVAICEGCSDEDLRKRLVASDTTILGIVKHEAYAERWWFQENFAGERPDYAWSEEDPDADFRIEDHETTEDILDLYARECDKSRAIFEGAGLDDLAARLRGGNEISLRWIVARMIWETARHCGHADILREQLDGATGLGHTNAPSIPDPDR